MTMHGHIKTAAIGTAVATAASLALLGPTTTATGAASAPGTEVRTTNGCLTSVPDPGTDRAGPDLLHALQAGRRSRNAPRADDPAQPRLGRLARRRTRRRSSSWLDAGYGVLSFDQRGFGESGGTAYVENPRRRGPRRPRASSTWSPTLRWVQQGRTRRPAARRDRRQLRRRLPVPRRLRGAARPRQAGLRRARPRDHLERPQPQPRPAGRRAHRVGARARAPPRLPEPGAAARRSTRRSSRAPRPASGPTAAIPGTANLDEVLREERPGRGTSRRAAASTSRCCSARALTDTLFNLQQGLDNWRTAITTRARKHSIFVGYNGGHVLPARLPARASTSTSDPCSKQLAGGDFAALAAAVHGREAQGQATPACRATASSTSPRRPRPVRRSTRVTADNRRSPSARSPPPRPAAPPSPTRSRRARSGSPGPPYLTGTMTALGVNNRAFYGLAVGHHPARRRSSCRTT